MTLVRLREMTEAEWIESNPILRKGEMASETDSGKFKMGDGRNLWSDLSYYDQGEKGDQGDPGDPGEKGDPGDPGESISGGIQTSKTVISVEEMLVLQDTPAILVPAPGVGKALVPLFIVTSIVFVSTPYSGPVPIYIAIGDFAFNNPANLVSGLSAAYSTTSIDPAGFFESLGIQQNLLTSNQPGIMNGNGVNPTDGDSPVIVTVLYTIVDVA